MNRKSAAFDPIDIHVGTRVRKMRKLRSMSQTVLGDAVSVTFQQLQKYERGANRIGASRLFELSQALEVPVSFFYDGMPEEISGCRNAGAGLAELGVFNTQDAEEILRAYYSIEDREVRRALFQIVKAMARSRSVRMSEVVSRR